MDVTAFEAQILRLVDQVEARQRAVNPTDGGAHQTDVMTLLAVEQGEDPQEHYKVEANYRRVRAALNALVVKGLAAQWQDSQNTFTVVDRDVVTMIGRLDQ